MRMRWFLKQSLPGITLLLMLAVQACAPKVEPADTVLRNGRFVTVDPQKPEAQALAIRGTGSRQSARTTRSPATWAPPLRSSTSKAARHTGLHRFARALHRGRTVPDGLNLTQARTWDDIVKMVGMRFRRPNRALGSWGGGGIRKNGIRSPRPASKAFPCIDALSKVSPDNPVLLTHASGHATIANARPWNWRHHSQHRESSGRRDHPRLEGETRSACLSRRLPVFCERPRPRRATG